MSTVIYEDEHHKCLSFSDLVEGEGIQSNQFLILDADSSAIIDPGGNLTYSRLYVHAGRHTTVKELDYVIASHQDPDIVASVSKWLVGTSCQVIIPSMWARFLPHFFAPGSYSPERIIVVPDSGGSIPFGGSSLVALPAHFLHSVGNMNIYDPVARVLFSGDIGASVDAGDASTPVTDFDAHVGSMIDFHTRYMTSNRACRFWAQMVRKLDPEWIVPQHGAPFKGAAMVRAFLTWLESLECGIDVFTQDDYQSDPAFAHRIAT